MEQNAKSLLKRISEKVSTLTDKPISQISFAPNYNEWRSYICQRRPYWEDISWRVKEPNEKGLTEVHLGFFSNKVFEGFFEGLDKTEKIARGKVDYVIKNENGIRLVWNVNLNDIEHIEMVEEKVISLLPEFIPLALKYVIKYSSLSSVDSNDNDMEFSEPKVDNLNTASEPIDWELAGSTAQIINPIMFQWVSSFFDSKNHESFNPHLLNSNCLRITGQFPKSDETSIYWFELNSTGIEFYFSCQNKGLYVEILNDFEDVNSYFDIDYDYGSTIARLLNQKYQDVFETQIESGNDMELDEDFKLYFIDNFVNYILNDVYFEE
jgi:hypothetical protein